MNQVLDESVIRVLDDTGQKTVGTGFVIADCLAVTCAHVMAYALGLDIGRAKEGLGKALKIEYYYNKEQQDALVDLENWSPADENDVVFLHLNPLPVGVKPVRLASARYSNNRPYESLGFPRQAGPYQARRANNKISGLVQVEGKQDQLQVIGNELFFGMSGAPIFDWSIDRVVGMVSRGRDDKYVRFVYSTTADTIAGYWKGLSLDVIEPSKPYMMEPLSDSFVERPQKYRQIVEAILTGAETGAVGITAALKGAGGYGKTTLARAICWDERIHEAFPDGVLWVTLGESVEKQAILQKIEGLVNTLGGLWKGDTEIGQAAVVLRDILKDKRLLLVVDDVWHRGDLDPFLQIGSRNVVLATTRNAETLKVAIQRFDVDEMREEEGTRLLQAGLPGGEEKKIRDLTEKLGQWPLLIALVNGVLRGRVAAGEEFGRSIDKVSAALNKKGGLEAFDFRDATQRSEAVSLTLDASIELLKGIDRYRFLHLAVFPEDVEIPLKAVETLWSSDGYETEELCRYLEGHSLLLRFDLGERKIRLHDVIRKYLIDSQDQKELHRSFLKNYQEQCADGWHSGPDDGYFFQHLPYHLTQAEQVGDLRVLLRRFRWLQAKLEATDINAVLSDYHIIFSLAERAGSHTPVDTLDAIEGALRLSAPILVREKQQLAGQLHGRLLDVPELADLLQEARDCMGHPWLRPLQPVFWEDSPQIYSILEHQHDIRSLAISGDGTRALSSSQSDDRSGTTIRFWNLKHGLQLFTVEDDDDSHWYVPLSVSTDGKWAIAAFGETIRCWNFDTCLESRPMHEHMAPVNWLAASTGAPRLVSLSEDGMAIIWDLETWRPICKREIDTFTPTRAWLDRMGEKAILASSTEAVVWDTLRDEIILKASLPGGNLSNLGQSPEGMGFSPDGRFVYLGNRQLDLQTGEGQDVIAFDQPVFVINFDQDGHKLYALENPKSQTPEITCWDIENRRKVLSLPLVFQMDDPITAITITPAGRWVAYGDRDHYLKVCDLQAETDQVDQPGVESVSIAGSLVVGRLENGQMLAYDISTGQPAGEKATHRVKLGRKKYRNVIADKTPWKDELRSRIRQAFPEVPSRFLRDNFRYHIYDAHPPYLLARMEYNARNSDAFYCTLPVYDLDQQREIAHLTEHRWYLVDAAFSPDGRYIVSVARDFSLRVWEVAGFKLLSTFTGDAQLTCCTAGYDPMTRKLVLGTGDEHGRVHIFVLEGSGQ